MTTAEAPSTETAASQAGGALASAGPLRKLVIAIHGIGDQYRHATIRCVVSRFARYFDFPAAVPLGSFYGASSSISAFRLQEPPTLPGDLSGIGFAEVYWADIPRKLQDEGYIIEESKAWARTVVERVRAQYGGPLAEKFKLKTQDFRDAANVLEEMVDTIALLGNLLFLAEKVGFPKFELDDLLTAYLGDVQIVADFAPYRQKILGQFRTVLDELWKPFRDQATPPEIYIVAHSEGTVIAFMALLQAMSLATPNEVAPPPRAEWIDHVRGFMTIGSPIDKHLILWPKIWRQFQTPDSPVQPPIRWRNYYDYGDPVGFDLDSARDWIRQPEHDYSRAFEFRDEDDFGFSRYILPGEAHNDYWTDGGVFGHFIQTVLGAAPVGGRNFAARPPNRWWAGAISYVVPYIIAFALVFTGTYMLAKSLETFVAPAAEERAAVAPNDTKSTTATHSYFVEWWHRWRGDK